MKIYHYVTGILNPTKSEVLDEEPEKDTKSIKKEEKNINYTRREVTFVFEFDSNKLLKIKSSNDDIMNSMKCTKYHFITQTDYTYDKPLIHNTLTKRI